MNHAIMRLMIHQDALPFDPPDDLILEAVNAGWQNTQHDDAPISTNFWIPVGLRDYPHAVILAKTRGYRRAEQRLGWGVLVVTRDTVVKLMQAVPEGERDSTLMQMFGLKGDAAEWWTRQY